jgi:hypothetical protein
MSNIISRLRISANRRYFTDANGKPVFWLGDTLWELFRVYPVRDAIAMIDKRRKQGFNVLQVMLTGLYDVTAPNLEGIKPLKNDNPNTPNPAYFEHLDPIIRYADKCGMTLVIGVYHQSSAKIITPANARKFARWVAERYRHSPSIIWTMYPRAEKSFIPVVRETAAGLREGDKGAHLITVHPDPSVTSSSFIHNEPWLDFNMIQTCLTPNEVYRMVTWDYERKPVKPVVLAEGQYEGTEFNREYTPLEIRRQAYWSFLAGGYHSYGHNNNWCAPLPWKKWIDSPGAFQMGLYKKIITSCRNWWDVVPDQSIFFAGRNGGLTVNTAGRSKNGDWVLAYVAGATSTVLRLDKITASGRVRATWINTATGKRRAAGHYPAKGRQVFGVPKGWEDGLVLLEAVKSR